MLGKLPMCTLDLSIGLHYPNRGQKSILFLASICQFTKQKGMEYCSRRRYATLRYVFLQWDPMAQYGMCWWHTFNVHTS